MKYINKINNGICLLIYFHVYISLFHIIHEAEERRHFQLSVRLSDECATIFVKICRRYRRSIRQTFRRKLSANIIFSGATLLRTTLEQWRRVCEVLRDSLTRLHGAV